jgi:hypothetical protein
MRPAVLLLGCAAVLAAAADAPVYRYSAPIQTDSAAPFVLITLPVEALRRSARADLSDLRVIDTEGRRAPHAWLPAPSAAPASASYRELPHFALPAPGSRERDQPADLEVIASGSNLVVRRRSGAPRGASGATATSAAVPGWLVDLGDPKAAPKDAPRPDALQLRWPEGATSFTATYRLQASDDLRQWRGVGSGTVLALRGAQAQPISIEQDLILLGPHAARFLRWYWDAPAEAPRIAAVRARTTAAAAAIERERADVRVAFTPEPAGAIGSNTPPPPPGSLFADLGGMLPLASLRLGFKQGTFVLPARVQVRERAAAPWHDVAGGVFYRIEREGQVSAPPPLGLHGVRARHLRIVPDPRAGVPAATEAELTVQVELPQLVFARQGTAPFRLQVGAVELQGGAPADAGALPLATLVPGGAEERAKFGRSTVGPFEESSAAAAQSERAERFTAWRPLVLWSVLVSGVALLGFMVWRLARGGSAGAARPSTTLPPAPQTPSATSQ